MEIKYNEPTWPKNINDDILTINKKMEFKDKIWDSISISISEYIIKQCYLKMKKCRFKTFLPDQNKNMNLKNYNENDFILLRKLEYGSLFAVHLIYLVEEDQIVLIKKPNIIDNEIPKLLKREVLNYSKISHPFLPKFYGTACKENYPIMEYINGKSLNHIEQMKLTKNEKISIIFELMIVIEYLHRHKFILRDLKPNNIIIDENKTLVLVDFDRMIKECCSAPISVSIGTDFAAPEIYSSKDISEKSDIFSLGKLIYYIINETKPQYSDSVCLNDFKKFSEMYNMYEKCINSVPDERPSIQMLIIEFLVYFHDQSQIKNLYYEFESDFTMIYDKKLIEKLECIINFPESPKSLNKLGIMYQEGKYFNPNYSKSIHYFTQAAKNNNSDAQYNLGVIYYKGDIVSKDINKSIYFLQQASNQNHLEALFNLGTIYYIGKYVPQSIDKAIDYFQRAEKLGHLQSQINLGIIYSKFDMNKSIYYFKRSANQNDALSQYNLGIIYSQGIHVPRDIDRAIFYFTMAANQNHAKSQSLLGIIYSNFHKDINKAIHYYTLAAQNNDPRAYLNLGIIYYKGEYVKQNINKSINYFIKADDPKSNLLLGKIFYENKYVQQNINKAIYYFSLASKYNSEAQFILGMIYYEGVLIERNINKGIWLLTESSKNRYINAHFTLGYLFHEGLYIEQDIDKSIHYYKEASSFNNQYAKNNLGVIFKNGFGDKVSKNIGGAIEYFKEAINQRKDLLSMYNLACIYLFEENIGNNIQEGIQLLISSLKLDFYPSMVMLCIFMCEKYDFDMYEIKNQINRQIKESKIIMNIFQKIIKEQQIDKFSIQIHLQKMKQVDYIYDYKCNMIQTATLMNKKKNCNLNEKEMHREKCNSLFYEGFEISYY